MNKEYLDKPKYKETRGVERININTDENHPHPRITIKTSTTKIHTLCFRSWMATIEYCI